MDELSKPVAPGVSPGPAPAESPAPGARPSPEPAPKTFTEDEYRAGVERAVKERFKNYQDYDTYKELAEALKEEGYDPKEVARQIRERKAQAQAESKGVAPEFYQEFQDLASKVKTFEQMQSRMALERHIAEAESRYKEAPIPFNRDEVGKIVAEQLAKGKLIDFEDAYQIHVGRNIGKLKDSTEQETLARVLGRDQKQVGSSTEAPKTIKVDYASMPRDKFLALKDAAKAGRLRK